MSLGGGSQTGKGTTMAARLQRLGSGAWLAVFGVFWMAASGCVILMLAGPFPLGNNLFLTYFIFVLSSIVCLHAGFFGLAALAREEGKKLSKKVPKYIEYAYAALISTALAQVFFAAPQFSEYINVVVGDEQPLLDQIKTVVHKHVDVDCLKRDAKFFTDDYCAKMKEIADAENLKSYLLETVAKDHDFLAHPIGQIVTIVPRTGEFSTFEWRSQLGEFLDRLEAKVAYSNPVHDTPLRRIYGWIALLVFPIGVALRLVKTSLELFVDME